MVSARFGLELADGRRWLLCAGDPQAGEIVAAFAKAMQLRPPSPGERGRELIVISGAKGLDPLTDLKGEHPIRWAVEELIPRNDQAGSQAASSQAARSQIDHEADDRVNRQVLAMQELGLLVAREAQLRGGLVLHGALACDGAGRGVILAGPGTVGKSTASRRLPPPWHSLCDDTTLVVRDAGGRYWAHPYPTWSRFYQYDGVAPLCGSWDTQEAVALHAICLLSQAEEDAIAPVSSPQAVALLLESTEQASRLLKRRLEPPDQHALLLEQLANVNVLVQAIPVFMLQVSLDGQFWLEIERVLPEKRPRQRETTGIPAVTQNVVVPTVREGWNERQRVVYRGASMNPTLAEPDLLEVEAYTSRPIRPGDVIVYAHPENGTGMVHRVVHIDVQGICTRGDHNPQVDPVLLQPGQVSGRVAAAQRGSKRRLVLGGIPGQATAAWAWLYNAVDGVLIRLLRRLYDFLGDWKPGSMPLLRRRWRVVVFQTRGRPIYRLLFAGRVIGQFDYGSGQWRIRRLFRLLVDESRLPHLKK